MDSIAEIKSGLHHHIAEIDDVKTLNILQKYVETLLYKEDKIIAYTSDGKALNHTAYKADIDECIDQAIKGNTVSIEEMEKSL